MKICFYSPKPFLHSEREKEKGGVSPTLLLLFFTISFFTFHTSSFITSPFFTHSFFFNQTTSLLSNHTSIKPLLLFQTTLVILPNLANHLTTSSGVSWRETGLTGSAKQINPEKINLQSRQMLYFQVVFPDHQVT